MVHTIDFAGKNVLITGGGRGLGVDIARTFAKAGANLVLTCKPFAFPSPALPRDQPAHQPHVLADNGTPADKLAGELSKEFGVKVLVRATPPAPRHARPATS